MQGVKLEIPEVTVRRLAAEQSDTMAATVTQWADEQLGIQAACKWRSLPSGKRFFTLTFGGRPRDVLKWAYAPGGARIPRKEVQADLWLSMCE